MALSLVTAPGTEPLSVADAKVHLRVEGTDEHELIQSLIVAAREYVETFTHRALISQTWDLKFDGFPCGDIWLPKPPVSSVTSISYVDTNGDTQTWDSSYYTTDLPTGPNARKGRVVLAYNQTYPLTRGVINAVTVRFVCGYGASAASVPDGIKAAMRLLIGHWYEHREATVMGVGIAMFPAPLAVESLLWPFKAF